MKVHVYYIGKTNEAYLREGEAISCAITCRLLLRCCPT